MIPTRAILEQTLLQQPFATPLELPTPFQLGFIDCYNEDGISLWPLFIPLQCRQLPYLPLFMSTLKMCILSTPTTF